MTTQPSVDPEAFDAFEHTGWERVARPYADYWGGLTKHAIEPLLAAPRAAVRGAAQAYAHEDAVELPMPTVLAFARV